MEILDSGGRIMPAIIDLTIAGLGILYPVVAKFGKAHHLG